MAPGTNLTRLTRTAGKDTQPMLPRSQGGCDHGRETTQTKLSSTTTASAQEVTCHGIDVEPFTCRVAHPDRVGEFCFPALASLITGAARLMLALLEYSVRELGGTYAMEDTDSMAIVATERGGEIPCPDGRVSALSWEQ